LLTIYDMRKVVDRGMTITDVKLLEKHEGKSGSLVLCCDPPKAVANLNPVANIPACL
jgi:hypothetical protein